MNAPPGVALKSPPKAPPGVSGKATTRALKTFSTGEIGGELLKKVSSGSICEGIESPRFSPPAPPPKTVELKNDNDSPQVAALRRKLLQETNRGKRIRKSIDEQDDEIASLQSKIDAKVEKEALELEQIVDREKRAVERAKREYARILSLADKHVDKMINEATAERDSARKALAEEEERLETLQQRADALTSHGNLATAVERVARKDLDAAAECADIDERRIAFYGELASEIAKVVESGETDASDLPEALSKLEARLAETDFESPQTKERLWHRLKRGPCTALDEVMELSASKDAHTNQSAKAASSVLVSNIKEIAAICAAYEGKYAPETQEMLDQIPKYKLAAAQLGPAFDMRMREDQQAFRARMAAVAASAAKRRDAHWNSLAHQHADAKAKLSAHLAQKSSEKYAKAVESLGAMYRTKLGAEMKKLDRKLSHAKSQAVSHADKIDEASDALKRIVDRHRSLRVSEARDAENRAIEAEQRVALYRDLLADIEQAWERIRSTCSEAHQRGFLRQIEDAIPVGEGVLEAYSAFCERIKQREHAGALWQEAERVRKTMSLCRRLARNPRSVSASGSDVKALKRDVFSRVQGYSLGDAMRSESVAQSARMLGGAYSALAAKLRQLNENLEAEAEKLGGDLVLHGVDVAADIARRREKGEEEVDLIKVLDVSYSRPPPAAVQKKTRPSGGRTRRGPSIVGVARPKKPTVYNRHGVAKPVSRPFY